LGWGLGKFVLDVDFVSILSDFQYGTDKGRICDRRFRRAGDRGGHCRTIVGVGLEPCLLVFTKRRWWCGKNRGAGKVPECLSKVRDRVLLY
jgi:hypothetical protein